MTIAIVINTSWNIFNFRKGLVKALIDAGHTLYAIAPTDSYSEKLKEIGLLHIPLEMNAKSKNPINDLILIYRFYKLYKSLNINTVLHYTIKPNIYGSLAASFLRIKVINNVSGLGTTFIRQNMVTEIVKVLYKLAFKSTHHIFFQNEDDKDLFTSNRIIPAKKVSVLPGSGIPLEEITYSGINPVSKPIRMIMCSRLLKDKGVEEFLGAAEQVKKIYAQDVEFILCGKEELNPKLGFDLDFVRYYIDNQIVNYLGHIDNVHEKIKQCHVAILPSYREGVPRALLEAAAIGLPIITTDAPGCKEVVINGENGYLCEVKNQDSLYNCMINFLQLSIIEKEIMGKKSRELVEKRFDEKLVITAYLDKI